MSPPSSTPALPLSTSRFYGGHKLFGWGTTGGLPLPPLSLPDPTLPGPWSFQRYSLGPIEEGQALDPSHLPTPLLDARGALEALGRGRGQGLSKWQRKQFGISDDALPIKGHVYLPVSTSPAAPIDEKARPVVLLLPSVAVPNVRGQEGYEALLQGLASHGMVTIGLDCEWGGGGGVLGYLEALFKASEPSLGVEYMGLSALKALDLVREWGAKGGEGAQEELKGKVQDNAMLGKGHAQSTQPTIDMHIAHPKNLTQRQTDRGALA